MRRVLTILTMVMIGVPALAPAQGGSETLADIRQELSVLYVELQKLKRELSTTGGAGQLTVGGSVLDRVAAIESELQRLTAKTEQLEFRIDQVVTDGTNRVGDLEFRICELEPGCDITKIEPGDTLGGVAPTTTGTTAPAPADLPGTDTGLEGTGGVELAVGEQADFDAAMAAFEAGEHIAAAEQFELFQSNYPGSPLSGRAGLKRGEALEAAGEQTQAARAYLDTFSEAPQGPQAAEALYLLGRALGRLGQTNEACVTLSEVGTRFPGADVVAEAQGERQRLSCP
ncbi:tetratricopeptide repeat protein [Roseovarius aestuariivivens]|uniref:tetratricopeptide repeat protein n=1 Tax=Roseovarius aestuariivivens TaxID=1888910 RepID=UPI0010819E45|nr:tetratricopeptide repeat protein [Roseovarius aestuariivivens]